MSEKSEQTMPPVEWDGTCFKFTLERLPSGVSDTKSIDATWTPELLYSVRIRKVGSDEWSPKFVTPFVQCEVVELEPGEEYEMAIAAMNIVGDGQEQVIRTRVT